MAGVQSQSAFQNLVQAELIVSSWNLQPWTSFSTHKDSCPEDQEIAFKHEWSAEKGYFRADGDTIGAGEHSHTYGKGEGYVSSLNPPFMHGDRDCSKKLLDHMVS